MRIPRSTTAATIFVTVAPVAVALVTVALVAVALVAVALVAMALVAVALVAVILLVAILLVTCFVPETVIFSMGSTGTNIAWILRIWIRRFYKTFTPSSHGELLDAKRAARSTTACQSRLLSARKTSEDDAFNWEFSVSSCNYCGIDVNKLGGAPINCFRCKMAYHCSSKCRNEDLHRHSFFCQAGLVGDRDPLPSTKKSIGSKNESTTVVDWESECEDGVASIQEKDDCDSLSSNSVSSSSASSSSAITIDYFAETQSSGSDETSVEPTAAERCEARSESKATSKLEKDYLLNDVIVALNKIYKQGIYNKNSSFKENKLVYLKKETDVKGVSCSGIHNEEDIITSVIKESICCHK